MPSLEACDLCGVTETSYVFGVPLCADCRVDPGRLDGLTVIVEHEQRNEVGDQITVVRIHDVRIEITPATPSPVSAKFTVERGLHEVLKLFVDEYQVGDARFDDAIYIRDDHKPGTHALLARSGAREAILALLKRGGTLEIEAGTIRYTTRDRDETDVEGYQLAAFALQRHVAAIKSAE